LSGSRPDDVTERPPPIQRALNSMNPEISVIGDFRAWYLSNAERNVDFEMHEVETALGAVVDPYARADVFISIAHEDGGFEFGLEEAYLTTLSLPYRLQLKAGKFRSVFGKLNRIHPHALPYIDLPAVYRNFLGDEGLNDQGLSLSWLTPLVSFYQELTVEVTRGPGDGPALGLSESNHLLYAGRLKNFWDLSEAATLEVGLSAASGPNPSGFTSVLGGLDLTYIWKPLQYNVYRGVTLQGEVFIVRNSIADDSHVRSWGGYALAGYRFARRWGVTGRYDHSDLPDDSSWNENGVSITLGWYLTEFQKLEVGIRTADASGMERHYQALIRGVFVIGTHGAHQY